MISSLSCVLQGTEHLPWGSVGCLYLGGFEDHEGRNGSRSYRNKEIWKFRELTTEIPFSWHKWSFQILNDWYCNSEKLFYSIKLLKSFGLPLYLMGNFKKNYLGKSCNILYFFLHSFLRTVRTRSLWEETLLALFLLDRFSLLLTSFPLLQIAEATVYFWYVQKACAILNSRRTAISWTWVFRALGLLPSNWMLQIKFAVLSDISLGRSFLFTTAPGF